MYSIFVFQQDYVSQDNHMAINSYKNVIRLMLEHSHMQINTFLLHPYVCMPTNLHLPTYAHIYHVLPFFTKFEHLIN